MIAVMRTFSYAMSILKTGEEAKVATDPLRDVDTCAPSPLSLEHWRPRWHLTRADAAAGESLDEIWQRRTRRIRTVLGLCARTRPGNRHNPPSRAAP
jgi:hypothetical protein